MLLVLGPKSTCPVGSNIRRLQKSCSLLLGGVGACVIVFATGSYSKNRMGCPQFPLTKLAPVKRTVPLGNRLAGQSLLTMVCPLTFGMSGPAIQVPWSVGLAGGV